MPTVDIDTLKVWCGACMDFHAIESCLAQDGKDGIYYCCPDTATDVEILLIQAHNSGGASA